MDSENTNCDDVIHNRLKKCGFCGKELQPIGLDYLYANISEDSNEEICTIPIKIKFHF